MKTDDCIEILNANKLIRSPNEAMAFECALAELARNPQPEDLPKLHLIFDDRCHQPEVMFSLIHFLESFPMEEQIGVFMKILPKLFAIAPNWTEILHTRIVNDKTACQFYRQQLRVMNECQPHLLRQWLEERAIS